MIASKNNDYFKYLRSLKQNKFKKEHQAFLVYGDKLVEEALKAGIVKDLITTNEFIDNAILISQPLMDELQTTNNNFDIIAVCKMQEPTFSNSNKVLILEDVQDPDNVGTLIRSALAFGFNDCIMSDKTANIYNDKVIRASAGAVFHINYEITDNLYKRVNELKALNYNIFITDTNGNEDFSHNNQNSALVLSNEGSGVSLQMKQLADEIITIPTENVESLNVAVAGAILMYEWSK